MPTTPAQDRARARWRRTLRPHHVPGDLVVSSFGIAHRVASTYRDRHGCELVRLVDGRDFFLFELQPVGDAQPVNRCPECFRAEAA